MLRRLLPLRLMIGLDHGIAPLSVLENATAEAEKTRDEPVRWKGDRPPQQASRHAKTDPPAVPLGHRPYYFRKRQRNRT